MPEIDIVKAFTVIDVVYLGIILFLGINYLQSNDNINTGNYNTLGTMAIIYVSVGIGVFLMTLSLICIHRVCGIIPFGVVTIIYFVSPIFLLTYTCISCVNYNRDKQYVPVNNNGTRGFDDSKFFTEYSNCITLLVITTISFIILLVSCKIFITNKFMNQSRIIEQNNLEMAEIRPRIEEEKNITLVIVGFAASEDLDQIYQSCTICITDFNTGEEISILPCFHRYHSECIVKWLEKERNCPVCRIRV